MENIAIVGLVKQLSGIDYSICDPYTSFRGLDTGKFFQGTS